MPTKYTAVYTKSRDDVPRGFFDAEASGLRFLTVEGGVRIVKPFEVFDTCLKMEFVPSSVPTNKTAYDFGRKLAVLHKNKAEKWGEIPKIDAIPAAENKKSSEKISTGKGSTGDVKIRPYKTIEEATGKEPGGGDAFRNTSPASTQNEAPISHTGVTRLNKYFFGPVDDPIPIAEKLYDNWYDYYKSGRIKPLVEEAVRRNRLTRYDLELTKEYCDNLEKIYDKKDADIAPSKVHGDLWSGNVMWSFGECVLIDPSAQTGHYEEDLAMLDLFGMPCYSKIIEGYDSACKLSPNFLHNRVVQNVFPILGHVVFYGGGYVDQYRAMLKRLLRGAL